MRKRRTGRIILLILLALFLVFAVPIIINESYKANDGYVTMWEAADVLSYYGILLGSTVTICALILTIAFTRKQIKNDRYIKEQDEKWTHVFTLIDEAIDNNNPLHLIQLIIDYDANNNQKTVTMIQNYVATAKLSADKIVSCVDDDDAESIKPLFDSLREFQKQLLPLALSISQDYMQIGEAISSTNEKWKAASKAISQKETILFSLHEKQYQDILRVQREAILRIKNETSMNAEKLLQFGRE